MAKNKNYVKEDTVKRIKNLLNKYSHEEMLNSKEFKSLTTHFINAYERKHINTIVELCCNDTPYDEIRLIIQQNESNFKSDTEEMDPVEEAVFMISQQKVIEVEPVKVTIGDEDSEEQKSATNTVVNADTSDNKKDTKSESQKSATEQVVKSDTTDNKKSSDETSKVEKPRGNANPKEDLAVFIMTQKKVVDSAEPVKKPPVEEPKVQQKSAKEKTFAEIFADYDRACEESFQRIVVRGEFTTRRGEYKSPVAEY